MTPISINHQNISPIRRATSLRWMTDFLLSYRLLLFQQLSIVVVQQFFEKPNGYYIHTYIYVPDQSRSERPSLRLMIRLHVATIEYTDVSTGYDHKAVGTTSSCNFCIRFCISNFVFSSRIIYTSKGYMYT
jgi:hypothetical protein